MSLHAAASAFGDFLENLIAPHDVVPPYPPARYASLSETFDAEALGHVIAAGVDQRLLEVKVRWDTESPPAAVHELVASAGEAAEELGVQLGRWTEELALRLPQE